MNTSSTANRYPVIRLHSLGDVLREHRRSRPNQLALVDRAQRFTYAQFDARTNRLAAVLRDRGVTRGQHVLWLGQNSFRVFEALLSCAKLGAVLCPANWRMSAAECRQVIEDFDPRVVIWQHEEVGVMLHETRRETESHRVWIRHDDDGPEGYEALVQSHADVDSDERIDPELPVLAIYTAAFDGKPGAALLAHSAIMYQNLVIGRAQAIDDASVVLNSGPLFHLGTLMAGLAAFHLGGCNVFLARMDAEELLGLVQRERVTHAFVPQVTLEQVRQLNASGQYDVSSLWSTPQAKEWVSPICTPADAPLSRLLGGYGQTEVMGLAVLKCFGGEGGAGRPGPMMQLRIVDANGNNARIGETGEIVVRGAMVMNGYHGRPGENERRSVDGWHHTNDLGTRLEDGSIRFVGPKTTMIKSAVENIYPVEVESCLRTHPAVADVCVIGIPDPTWGQAVKAIAVLKPEHTVDAEELIEHCRARIASYKKPRHVEFAPSLPRLPSGAVDRKAVDAAFGGGGYPSA